MDHKLEALPQWAQDRIRKLESDLANKNYLLEEQSKAHAVLHGRSWFTVPGPVWQNPSENFGLSPVYRLWFLDRDSPLPACSLGPSDILLVGRAWKPGEDPYK